MQHPTTTPHPSPNNQTRNKLAHLLQTSPVKHLPLALDCFRHNPDSLFPSNPPPSPLSPNRQHHFVIILGTPVLPTGLPSPGILSRTHLAAALTTTRTIIDPKSKTEPIIVVTGGAVQNRFSEAEVMREELIRLGVSEGKGEILVEGMARTTVDNAAYTMDMLLSNTKFNGGGGERAFDENDDDDDTDDDDDDGGSRLKKKRSDEVEWNITIVTEPFHSIRSLRIFYALLSILDLPMHFKIKIKINIKPSERATLPPLRSITRNKKYSLVDGSMCVKIGGFGFLDEGFRPYLERCLLEKRHLIYGY